ncbi:MAG TPA: FAD-dependent monooxygenase [Stellaceae bacterium]|nr:FAD-dependent monooxygenase [Stellaceae bacterium]
MRISKPVLIIGAGPVGMTVASELKRYGVPVRIIDQAPQRTDKSKALVLWSRTLELLDRGGGAAPFVDAGLKAGAFNFTAGDGVVGRVSMAGVQSPYPFGLMLPQSETERLLEERLSHLDVAIERRTGLVEFKSGPSGIEALLRHGDGREQTVSADWLIGCDGAHSTVRHGLGASFTGETLESDWMLADVHLKGYPVPTNETSIYWHRDGILVAFPISPGRYRVVADLPTSGGEHPATPTLEQVQAVIDRRGPRGLVAFDPVWLSGFRIDSRKVSSYRWGRVSLAGDAAHVHSPAGGQGMNTGMQDTFNLAWKLALVVQGTCGEHLLDSYSPERSKVGEEVLKTTHHLTTIGTLRNPVAQTVRNLVSHVMLGLAPVQHAMADRVTEVSIGYSESPLNGPSLSGVGPKPGERIKPVAGEVPVGSGSTPCFALFAERTVATADLLRRYEALLDPVIRPPLRKDGIWLARPDGYAACSASNPEIIGRYLDGVIGNASSISGP